MYIVYECIYRNAKYMKFKLLLIVTSLLFISVGAHAGEWIVDSKTNYKAWNDYPQPNETISWSGECVDGYASGSGTIIWYENGKETDQYKGEMRKGKCTGKGTYIWANGDKYEGDYVDGKFNGKGTHTGASGGKYQGDFVNNKPSGEGTLTNPNGTRCTGVFQDGKPVGGLNCTVGNTGNVTK
jgi:hypothetical protein